MIKSGTIYPDGRVSLDGYVPNKTRLVAINSHLMVIHHPGQNWSDNGGRHYGPANYSVETIESLERGNEEGTWRFRIAPLTPSISFPTLPSSAVPDAMLDLRLYGDRYVEAIQKRISENRKARN
jgi:hypothetical protein